MLGPQNRPMASSAMSINVLVATFTSETLLCTYMYYTEIQLCLQFDNSNNMQSNPTVKKMTWQEMTLIGGH